MSISGAVNSKKVDLSSIRKEQGTQDGQQGRLPGAIRPQNAKDLAFLDLQANPFQGLFSPLSPPPRPVGLVDILCSDCQHLYPQGSRILGFTGSSEKNQKT